MMEDSVASNRRAWPLLACGVIAGPLFYLASWFSC